MRQGTCINPLCFFAVLFIAVFFTTIACAQNDVGSIVGFVTDASGAVVTNAQVTVTNQGTRETHTQMTDAKGHYTFPNLVPSIYTVKVVATGFKEFDSSSNTLPSNSTIDVDAKLIVGQQSQTVQVTDTAAILQTQSAAVQSEITGTQIQLQELNGRNPIYMTQFLPGVASAGGTISGFNFVADSGDTFYINGARRTNTTYTLDGSPAVRTRGNGAILAGASVDAVQEMQVLAADYSAEYGGASGAQVRIVTKSGTTNFHGTAYEYIRNAVLNANSWSRNLNPATRFASPFTYNNFGFAVGGPIWAPNVPILHSLRDKFFFFVTEDWIRYRMTATSNATEPTTRMRTGDFSELLVTNPYYPAGTRIYEPSTCPILGAPTCVAFPGNIIPPGAIPGASPGLSPNGVAIMNAYPATTPNFQEGSLNWAGSAPAPQNQRKGQINGDLLVTPNNHIMFRRSDAAHTIITPFVATATLITENQIRPNETDALGWTWTINPTMINEAHFSVSIDDVYNYLTANDPGLDRGSLGITPVSPNGIDFPYIIAVPKVAPNKIPSTSLPTFTGLNPPPYPSTSAGIIYIGSDSLTKVLGNHTLKGGFLFNYSGENDEDQISGNQNGSFTFSNTRTGLGGTTGVGLANQALGLADSYTEVGAEAYTVWRGKFFEFFAQDNWQVNSKLNLDYGIRASIMRPPYAQWANADYFDPPSYNPANAVTVSPTTGLVTLGSGNAYNGVVIPGWSSFPSAATYKDRVPAANPDNKACAGEPCTGLFAPKLRKGYVSPTVQFQPRFGLAYQIFPKTVVRFGVGRFVENMGIVDNIFPGGNSPFQGTKTVNNVPVDNPGTGVTTAVEPALALTTMAKNLVPPTRWNWNIAIQQRLPWRSSGQIAYVGARGLHDWRVVDINQAPVGALVNNPGDNINYLRPYKGFSSIQQEQSTSNGLYNSLQLSWTRQFGVGSMFTAAYTWSKSMDDGSMYPDLVPDSYNTSNLWGPSQYDNRHMLFITYLYDVPFFTGQHTVEGKLLGGWQISGSMQFTTGIPNSVGLANDYAGVGELGSFYHGLSGQFWVQKGKINTPKKFAGPSGGVGSPKWFNTTNGAGNPIWTAPATGTFNLQKAIRDNVYAPGVQQWNMALIKSFPIYKTNAVEFRAEAYNAVNHPILNAPSYNPTSPQFGEVTGKGGTPRTLQLGLRYRF